MAAKDFLALDDVGTDALEVLARRAIELSTAWNEKAMPRCLEGQRIGVINELPDWQNPMLLTLGAMEMGATCVPASLEGCESLEDLARYLDKWFDCVVFRTPSLGALRTLVGMITAPALNLQTDDNHPIEVLADLTCVLDHRGSFEGLKVAVIAPEGNILQSWIEVATELPISVVQVSHPSFYAHDSCMRFSNSENLSALENADVIVADCWPEGADSALFAKFTVSAGVLDSCKKDVIFIPRPSVTLGREVSVAAMAHLKCTAQDARAYLLHVQNAVLENVLKG